jgi:hypothetical protein
MKTMAANAPLQLRKEMHIGSFMDVIFLDLIRRFNPEIEILIQWNALGKFREKDQTDNTESFNQLFNKMSGLINDYCRQNDIIHLIDDDQKIYKAILEIVSELISQKIIQLKEYLSWYCESCDSYLGPVEQDLRICKQCSSSLTQKTTIDLFIAVDKRAVLNLAKKLSFVPKRMSKKFLGVFSEMPTEFIITKSRLSGFSAENIDATLKNKVFDPKFIYSLFPVLLEKIGLPKISTIVLGEDILGRYLYYLLANGQHLQDLELKIIVHGMLVSNGKKISKYGNLPEISNIDKFLENYSWEHLKLLSVSANIGDNIDFAQKISETSKLITKKKNVMIFLEQALKQELVGDQGLSETEKKIFNHCEQLLIDLKQFELFNFYSNYRRLWFELLSRDYISELKNKLGSKAGLEKIINEVPLIF